MNKVDRTGNIQGELMNNIRNIQAELIKKRSKTGNKQGELTK